MKQVLINENILFILPKTYNEFIEIVVQKTNIQKNLLIIKHKNKQINNNNYYLINDSLNNITVTNKLLGGNNYPSFNSLLKSFILYFSLSLIISIVLIISIFRIFPMNEPIYSILLTTLIVYYVISVSFSIILNKLKTEHCPGYKNSNLPKIGLYSLIPFVIIILGLIIKKIFKINIDRIITLGGCILFLLIGNYVSYSISNSLKKYEDEKIPFNIKDVSLKALGIIFLFLLVIASPYLVDKNKKINKTEIFILLTISMIFTIMYTLPEYLEIYFHYIASPFVKCPK
jgi:hypothetical protein